MPSAFYLQNVVPSCIVVLGALLWVVLMPIWDGCVSLHEAHGWSLVWLHGLLAHAFLVLNEAS